MKIKTSLLLLMFAAFFLQSCDKKGLELYDETANGSSIYFREALSSKTRLLKTVSFGFSGYSVQDSIVAIPIAVTGNPSSNDRPFQLKTTDSTTAVSGTHYTFLRPALMRAGRVVDTLLIKINRTADMATQQFQLSLVLEQNNLFNTKLGDTAVRYTNYKILMDDIVGVSYLWTTYSRRSTIISYFGAYSRKKVSLMIEVLKLSPDFFYDPLGKAPTSTQVVSYSRYMYYWLDKEAAQGRVYKDENGQEIKMGQLAT